MRYDLLKMVQLILSAMDSDEVNDINDTTESRQVVDVIEVTYNDICSTIDFPDHWALFELEPSLDVSRPTLMSLPPRVSKLEWIRYDRSEDPDKLDFYEVRPMDRERFFSRMNSLDASESNVYRFDLEIDGETFPIVGKNDAFPNYYTTANNGQTLIFDNYVLTQGQTLIKDKTKCYGMKHPAFVRDNDFVAPLEPRQFSLFFNEAKSQAFLDIKQVENAKAEQRARRGWVQSGRKKNVTAASPSYHTFTRPFGRRGRK